MDESETFINDEKDDLMEIESETEKSNILESQEHATSSKDQDTDARAFAMKSKRICKDGNLVGQQEKDKAGSSLQRTVQVTPEEESVAHQVNLDNFSAKKKKYIESIVLTFKNAKTFIKRIKFIGKEDKVENEMTSKSKPLKIFTKKKKFTFQVQKGIETPKDKRKFLTELQDFKDSMPRGVDSKKAKPKTVVLRKYEKNSSSKPQSLSVISAKPEYMSKLCTVQPTSVPRIPRMSSKVRSAEEVLAHFRRHMQSKSQTTSTAANNESLDRIITGGISEENMETFSESDLQDPTKAETEFVSRDMKDRTKAVMESAMTQESRKVTSEESATRGDNLTATSRDTSSKKRQRIVYDEDDEQIRHWIIQQIKDKEVALKFSLMEGKYSSDVETKMSSIEKAKNIQTQIDVLFDTLDDHDKTECNPKRSKDFWRSFNEKNRRQRQPMSKRSIEDLVKSATKSIEDLIVSPTKSVEDLFTSPTKSIEDLFKSPTKSIEDLFKSPTKCIEDLFKSPTKRIEYSERSGSEKRIQTLLKLFRYLTKSLGSEAENEKILKRIDRKKLLSEYNKYIAIKRNRHEESKEKKCTAISVVEDFYLSLEQCRSRVKSKITRPEIRTLEDYQNYIRDLTTAAKVNLDCLCTLTDLATSILPPLVRYLCQSRKKLVDIFTFLNKKPPYRISESSNRNKVFFENFCQQHFKNQ